MSDIGAVRREALMAFGEVPKDAGLTFWNRSGSLMHVVDERGAEFLSFAFNAIEHIVPGSA